MIQNRAHKFRLTLLLFCAAFFIPTHSLMAISSTVKVQSLIAPNGLHVIQHYRPYSRSVSLQMVVNIGLKEFDCHLQQTPHVLEHMLLAKTSRYAEGEMRKTIKNLGGSWKGYTTREYTHYTISIHSDHIDTGLSILHSLLFEASLSINSLHKSTTAIHAEIGTTDNTIKNLINDKPSVKDLGIARLYSGSNLDCTTKSSPSAVTLSATQEALQNFYQPQNMTLIVVGDFNEDSLTKKLLSVFNKKSANTAGITTGIISITPLTTNTAPIIEHSKFSASSVYINLLLPATGKGQQYSAEFQLISDYLGEKLFYDLRSNLGIAYSPRATYKAGSNLGFIHAIAETTPQWAEKTVERFNVHYQSLRQQGIPNLDLQRLKSKAILTFESKERNNSDIAQLIRHHRQHIKQHGAMPNLVNNIHSISEESVQQVIQTYLPETPVMATVRPISNLELLMKIVAIILLSALIALPMLRHLRKRRLAK